MMEDGDRSWKDRLGETLSETSRQSTRLRIVCLEYGIKSQARYVQSLTVPCDALRVSKSQLYLR